MKKVVLTVPEGVKFLSQWEGFQLPNGIFNKGLTGCGGTTVALTDQNNTVICCPRNELIRNKVQWCSDSNVPVLAVIGGVTKEDVIRFLDEADGPVKMLSSYDSLWKIVDVLKTRGLTASFRVVVDEFQCLLNDCAFKSEVEQRTLTKLQEIPYVTYMSATPILDRFLDEIPEFEGVTYYELDWGERVERVKPIPVRTNDPLTSMVKILELYNKGIYEEKDGVESKECVVFVNSVNAIVNMVRLAKLDADDVNIVVANNFENDTIVKQLGKKFALGHILGKNEGSKKFTFCTSTAYFGCDIYSESAQMYALCDYRRETTKFDISTELCQMVGRCRTESNPFRNQVTLIYSMPTDWEQPQMLTAEDLKEKADMLIEGYAKNSKVVRKIVDNEIKTNPKETFLYFDGMDLKFNNLAMVAYKFNTELREEIWSNGINLMKEISAAKQLDKPDDEVTITHQQICFSVSTSLYPQLMELYCTTESPIVRAAITSLDTKYNTMPIYYSNIGPERCKVLGYKEYELRDEYNRCFDANIAGGVYSRFESGCTYSCKEVKKYMSELYAANGVKATANATDLEDFFVIETGVKRLNGKPTRTVTIVSEKRICN